MAIKKEKPEPKERKVRTSNVPPNETKEQKFVRLATRRVNKVRKALDQIGLLGSASYASTDKQREAITEALQESLAFNLNRLNNVRMGKSDFRL